MGRWPSIPDSYTARRRSAGRLGHIAYRVPFNPRQRLSGSEAVRVPAACQNDFGASRSFDTAGAGSEKKLFSEATSKRLRPRGRF